MGVCPTFRLSPVGAGPATDEEPLIGDGVTAGIVRVGGTAWVRHAAPAIAARLVRA